MLLTDEEMVKGIWEAGLIAVDIDKWDYVEYLVPPRTLAEYKAVAKAQHKKTRADTIDWFIKEIEELKGSGYANDPCFHITDRNWQSLIDRARE